MTVRPLRRVVLDGLPLQVKSAGVAVYTDRLVRALAHARPDLDIRLFGLSRLARRSLGSAAQVDARPALPDRVRWVESFWYAAAMGYPASWGARMLPIEALCGRADVFHGTNYGAPRRRTAAVVVTVHDLALLRFPELGTPGLRAHVENAVAGLTDADRIIADSEATAADLRTIGGADPARIRVVHPGVDPRFGPQDPKHARAFVAGRFGLERRYILHVGTLEPRKNLVTLLRAFARLPAGGATAPELVLVGRRGWMYEPVLDAIDALRLGDRVRRIEDAADDELPALYAAADVFAYPSRYEGFGLPVVEAMACGVPVLTSDNSSLPEVAGDATLLVDARDEAAIAAGLARLLDDRALRGELARRGLDRARTFSWERCARETLAVYEEAVSRKRQC